MGMESNHPVHAGKKTVTFELKDDVGVGVGGGVGVDGDAGGRYTKDHHIVEIMQVAGTGEGKGRCVVCMEPLAWAAVGWCRHADVCSKCMIRIRHVNDDRTCRVCGAFCPNVMVYRAAGAAAAIPAVVSTFKEYWYHPSTAAYFDNERQYQEAREACSNQPSPYHRYYRPLYISIPLFVASIFMGAVLGFLYTKEMKHMSIKVVAYALTIFFCISLIAFMWLMVKWYGEVDQEEKTKDHKPQVASIRLPLHVELYVAHLKMNP